MTQDDQQPDRAPGNGMSRDTLLLLGALTFLILAVALTFLFTPNNGQNAGSTTATALAATAAAEGPGYPAPATPGAVAGDPYPADGTPAAGLPDSQPTVGAGPGYPAPGAESSPTAGQAVAIPTGDPLAEASPTLDPASGFASPTPDPVGGGFASPTTGAAGGVYPDPAYPGPVGEGTPPPIPTFNPTVIQPTVARPVAPTAGPPAAAQPTFAQPTFAQPTAAPPTFAQPTTAPPTFAQPTTAPPTAGPPEGPVVEPTDELAFEETPAPAVPLTPAPPPPPPADVLRGNARWSAAQSPIILKRDVQVAPGSELIIEPGVEVRLDPGVSIYVDGGRLMALGQPDRPVRFVGSTGARWSGIFGRPGSYVVLENAEVRGGGVGGTVMAVERSELVVRSSRFNDNGGAILLTDTKLEMLNSEVAGNDMPFGGALEATYGRGNFITMRGNRFGGNRLGEGAPQVRVSNSSTFETLNLAIDGNLIRGGSPNLQLATNGPLKGDVTCNALVGDANGLSLRTQTPQVAPNGVPPMQLRVENNVMDEHIPPVIPVYLRYGLGRGATSEILLDMRNNWWGEPSGPYEPNENADGRGDSVGENIVFAPWLTAPPACAPAR